MDLLFIGHLTQTIGELFLAYTVLRVHHGVMSERRIDKEVLKKMQTEQFIGIFGVTLIIVGFIVSWITLA